MVSLVESEVKKKSTRIIRQVNFFNLKTSTTFLFNKFNEVVYGLQA